ncbi:MAG: hypothetical protein ACTHJ4_06045 [Candidatus Nucleicultricaceae bacterium]
MELPTFDENQFKFPIPSGIVVSGPSGSGKTELVLRLLRADPDMFEPAPKAIVWAYGEYSALIPKLERMGYIVHAGSPSDEFLKMVPTPFLIVFDDMQGDMDAKRLAELYTKKSHHNNFTVIFLAQNLFDKIMRTPRSNAQYLILMRAPNDMLSVRNLAHQIFPREGPFFLNAYKQACAQPFGYLLVCLFVFIFLLNHFIFKKVSLHASTPEILKLRTNIFPGEEGIVFAPKNAHL